jgi:peroxidase
MHTLFVQEHNRLVGILDSEYYRGSSDEELYQMARKIVGAEIQVITYKEFLPHLLGPNLTPDLAS